MKLLQELNSVKPQAVNCWRRARG